MDIHMSNSLFNSFPINNLQFHKQHMIQITLDEDLPCIIYIIIFKILSFFFLCVCVFFFLGRNQTCLVIDQTSFAIYINKLNFKYIQQQVYFTLNFLFHSTKSKFYNTTKINTITTKPNSVLTIFLNFIIALNNIQKISP